jgi:hypothetical protein
VSEEKCESAPKGEVWRKDGPCDWLRIVDSSFDHDGLNGVSVQFRNHRGNWLKQRWFFPCDSYEEFCEAQRANSRYRAASATNQDPSGGGEE